MIRIQAKYLLLSRTKSVLLGVLLLQNSMKFGLKIGEKKNLALFFFKTLKIVHQWPGSGTIFYLGDPESRYGSPCKWNGSYALKKGDLFYTIPFTVTTSYSSSCHCLNSNMFYLKSIIIPTGRPILTEFLKSQKIKFKTFLIEYSVRSFLDNSLIKS